MQISNLEHVVTHVEYNEFKKKNLICELGWNLSWEILVCI